MSVWKENWLSVAIFVITVPVTASIAITDHSPVSIILAVLTGICSGFGFGTLWTRSLFYKSLSH